MKKLPLYMAVLAVILSTIAIYHAKSCSELVYVDVSKLVDGYSRTKTAKAEFEKKASAMKANVDSLISNWQTELKKYEKDRVSMSPKELKLQQELLSNKQQQINNYQEGVQKKIQEEDSKLTQTVISDINDYVKEYGKSNGYKIIFGASGSGNIMFAAESTDLTETILKGLNDTYAKK